MSGYLRNLALRGAGLCPMSSIRPRKSIFESSNVTSPFVNNAPNEINSDGPDRFYNPTECAKPVSRDVQHPVKAEVHLAMPGAPTDSLPTNSITDPVVEDIVSPDVSSNEKTSQAIRSEMQNIETGPLRDVAHTPRPALNPKLSVHSIKATGSSPLLFEETQVGPHTPKEAVMSSSEAEVNETKKERDIASHLSTSETRSKNLITATPETMKRKGNTPSGPVVSEQALAKDVAEDFQKYTSIKNNLSTDAHTNYHEASSLLPGQSYMKDGQEIIKPVSPSKIEKTKIKPIRQTPFSRIGPVIKKAAIQPETKQTVKVNIGKVEVRAAPIQQPHTAPPPQKPVKSGFGDYLLVRNYGFSER